MEMILKIFKSLGEVNKFERLNKDKLKILSIEYEQIDKQWVVNFIES